MIKKLLSFLVLLLFVVACKSGKDQANTSSKSSEAYKEIASEALGNPIVYLFNTDSTYVMCQHLQDKTISVKGNEVNQGLWTDFMVIRISDNEVVFKKRLEGKVTWHSQYELKIAPTKGILEDNSAYYHDVRKQQKAASE